MANKILILLGSNINPEQNLPAAVELLSRNLTIQRISRIYETPPFGMDGDNFLNAAVEVLAELSAEDVKQHILREVESQLGRQRSRDKFIPRTIDLDIIVFNETVVDREVFEQPHVMLPASDLRPDLIEPSSGSTLKQLAEKHPLREHIYLRENILLPHSD